MKIKNGFRLREVLGQSTVVGEGIEQLNFDKLIRLNKAAAYLWKSVEGKEFTEDDLVKLLCDHYDVDIVAASNDVKTLVKEWRKVGLIF